MILSRSSEYAIRLIFYLLEKQPLLRFVRIRDAAADMDVPYYQLAKVANIMISKDILVSSTGPNGGIDLCRNAPAMTLSDIINIFGDGEVFENCILGLKECSSEVPCPIHSSWVVVKDEIIEIFSNRTLGQLQQDEVFPIIRHFR